MGHSTDIELLRKRFAAGWNAAGDPSVPILWDDDKADATPPMKFIRFSVRPSLERVTSLGNERNRVERRGRVWLQVAVPVGTPDGEAWALADKAAEVFKRWRSADASLSCGDSQPDVVPDKTHYIIAVKVSYQSSRVE